MIDHGLTGFLANSDEELAHYAAMLAYDEPFRQRIIRNAYIRLVEDLARPETIWEGWQRLFQQVAQANAGGKAEAA
jgi:hypothetical protein